MDQYDRLNEKFERIDKLYEVFVRKIKEARKSVELPDYDEFCRKLDEIKGEGTIHD